MPKKYLILIGLGIVLLFIAVLIFAISGGSKNASDPPNSRVPDYTLVPAEETVIKQVAVNFASLYNTYSSMDVTNITSMGDYQTESMQREAVSYADRLRSALAAGYSIRTNADGNTFAFRYPESDTIYATVGAAVEENVPQGDGSIRKGSYKITATMEFKKVGDRWLVNSISYQK